MKKRDRNFNWVLVGHIRYALDRGTEAAYEVFYEVVFDILEEIKDPEYKKYTFEKLIEEINYQLSGVSAVSDSWLFLKELLKSKLKELEDEELYKTRQKNY